MSKKTTFLFVSCVVCTTITSTFALSPVYVNPTYTNINSNNHSFGIDAFTTIQDGINAVDQGGIVYVAQGTYDENIQITKSLSLVGEGQKTALGAGKYAPHINGGVNTNPAVITVNGTTTQIIVTIRNFTITHANSGINVLQNALMVVENNTIHSYHKNGITFGPFLHPGYGGVRGIIRNNVIKGNGPTNAVAQNGIQVSESNTASITNNHVSNHIYTVPDSWWGVGILTNQSNGISMYKNILIDNQAGINIKEGSYNLISNNKIIGTTTTEVGILLSEPDNDSRPVRNNIITNNNIIGGKKSILAYSNTTNNFVIQNMFNAKRTGITVNTPTNSSLSKLENNEGMVLGATVFAFLHNLQEGNIGNDVVELQKILIMEGFLGGQATGYFDLQTKNALINWQTKNNIPATGYFGPTTRGFINSKNN